MKYAYKGEKWHLVLQPMHVAKCIVLYGTTVTDSWIVCMLNIYIYIYIYIEREREILNMYIEFWCFLCYYEIYIEYSNNVF